jgi:hypothetical protein
VTACALTAANLPDGPTGVGLLAGEQPGLEVLGDSAYGGGRPRGFQRSYRRWRPMVERATARHTMLVPTLGSCVNDQSVWIGKLQQAPSG